MAGRSNMFKPPKQRPYQDIPHTLIARRFQELAMAQVPDHQELTAIHNTLNRMAALALTLDICRGCYRRYTTSRSHRYCFITCRGPHHRAELAPDPTGTLRLAFEYSPTLLDLQDELDWRFPLPTHLFDAA